MSVNLSHVLLVALGGSERSHGRNDYRVVDVSPQLVAAWYALYAKVVARVLSLAPSENRSLRACLLIDHLATYQSSLHAWAIKCRESSGISGIKRPFPTEESSGITGIDLIGIVHKPFCI